MRKNHLILLILAIFILSLAVNYWPIYHKGFSYKFSADNLILARNLSLADKYSITDEKNIVLSSALVAERGVDYNSNNILTPLIYGKLFDLFGFRPNLPLYVSLILYAFSVVLLFLLVLRRFNLYTALFFSAIYIFSPFIIGGAIWFGFYEWAVLFFSIGIVIYFWNENPKTWRLIISSIFFGLAALARNAFLVSFIALLIYDFYSNFIYKKDWKLLKQWLFPAVKRIFIFVLPVVLLWGGVMIKDYLGDRNNPYIKLVETYDDHLFPDPYTYHFEKEQYIEHLKSVAQEDQINGLIGYGYLDSWGARIKMHFISLKYYINYFFRQPTLGGPVIIFFLILGIIFLYRKDKKLFVLPVFWIVFLFLILIGLRTTNEDHFIEIAFPLILLTAVGLVGSMDWLKQVVKNHVNFIFLASLIILVLFVHLIQSDKWMFHENYLYTGTQQKEDLLTIIKNVQNIGIDEVIVVPGDCLFFNYYTDYNCVNFAPETVKKLLSENKLQWAFGQFGVTRVAGFGELLNERIAGVTNVQVIDAETN